MRQQVSRTKGSTMSDAESLIDVAVSSVGKLLAIQPDAADFKIHTPELERVSTLFRRQLQSTGHDNILRADVPVEWLREQTAMACNRRTEAAEPWR